MIIIAGIEVKYANLFVNSKTSDDYFWVKDSMNKNHKYPHLSSKEFSALPEDKKEFLKLKWIEIFNLAQSEWKVISKFQKNQTKSIIDCQLCGHKELDLISIIENMENGNKFIVGSTCICKFDRINNNNVSDYNDYKKQKRIDERKISNEEYLESSFRGIIRNIKEFISIRNDETLIMNNDLEKEYDRLNKLLDSDYYELLKIKQNKINLKQIKFVYDSVGQFLLDVKEYKKTCEKNKWGINSKIAKWCNENGNKQLINLLKYTGNIDYFTVDQIKEPNYLKKVIYLFKPLIEKSGMKLAHGGRVETAFNISVNKRENIFLDVSSISLIKMKKDYLFNKEYSNIGLKEILSNGNGRTGRLILNFELMKNGYAPINIKYKDRRRYYDAFKVWNEKEDSSLMVDLICDYLIEELKRYISLREQ